MIQARYRLAAALLLAPIPAQALAEQPCATTEPSPVQAAVEGALADAPQGARFGFLVTTMEGDTLVAIAPDQRFIPASNTKIYTSAAAYAVLPELERTAKGTGVRIEPVADGTVDVVLYGRGDARMSSAPDCTVDCLRTLADAVAAKARRVRHVVGDDSWLPDERWGPGMSWNNIQSRYGTGISALTVDDNEWSLMLTPGKVGASPTIAASPYFTIDNRVATVEGKEEAIVAERAPGSRTILLTGTVGADAAPVRLRFGIDDPAHYAAWRMRDMLIERGVQVDGDATARHRPLLPFDDPKLRGDAPPTRAPELPMLAELQPPPLADDVRLINKDSQNLYADLMLRRLGRLGGSGSIADGQAALRATMTVAGVAPEGYGLADGSGMSSYNRITPRATVTLLSWVARQPWGDAWRATLPIAGVDGTLRNRFKGTSLEGRLFAKTGTLNASRALSGYLFTKSGRTLIFSTLANDMPEDTDAAASAAVDRALVALADAL